MKSITSQLYRCVKAVDASFYFLLTGTPVQNNIFEFYSLLTLVDPMLYVSTEEKRDAFCSLPQTELEKNVLSAVKKYLLRRMKSEVAIDIPDFQEIVLFHGLTSFQKDFYNSILVNDRSKFFEA